MRSMEGAVVLLTGATDGIGEQIATALAGMGATVLLHGRDERKAREVQERIRSRTENGQLRYYLADLSSLAEARRLAEEVASDYDRLDVLINNAGIMSQTRIVTDEGIEQTFAVNYLSPYLLTRLLIPSLRRAADAESPDGAPSRVVNVTSAGQSPIDFSDPMLERGYDGMRAYGQSKLALAMFTFELAEELGETGITVNCLHPGTLLDTNMVRENFGSAMGSVEEGAEAVTYLATSPELEDVTGRYFDGKRESRVNEQAYDPQARDSLRNLSAEITGLG